MLHILNRLKPSCHRSRSYLGILPFSSKERFNVVVGLPFPSSQPCLKTPTTSASMASILSTRRPPTTNPDDFTAQQATSSRSSRGSSADAPSSYAGDISGSSTSTLSLVHGQPRRRPIPRKGHTKSRRGCLNCKRRRVKCPETIPSCENCHRLNLRCEYPEGQGQEVSLLEPRPARQMSNTQLSMTDLHFFHHFLLYAYPGLPIQGETVWREVAQLSHME